MQLSARREHHWWNSPMYRTRPHLALPSRKAGIAHCRRLRCTHRLHTLLSSPPGRLTYNAAFASVSVRLFAELTIEPPMGVPAKTRFPVTESPIVAVEPKKIPRLAEYTVLL